MPTTSPLLLTEYSKLEETLFQDLPPQLRHMLLEKGSIRDYVSGATILMPGDLGDQIRFLLSGKASVFIRSEEVQEITVELLGAGDLIGEISYLTGRPSPLNSEVIAQESCKVLEIPAQEFEQILKAHPECAISVLRMLARKVIKLDHNLYKNIRKTRPANADKSPRSSFSRLFRQRNRSPKGKQASGATVRIESSLAHYRRNGGGQRVHGPRHLWHEFAL